MHKAVSSVPKPKGKEPQGDNVLNIECNISLQSHGRNTTHGTVVISGSIEKFMYGLEDSDREIVDLAVRALLANHRLL